MSSENLQSKNKSFLKEINSLIEKLKTVKGIEKRAGINFLDLTKIAEFLAICKPQSHMNNYKDYLLDYLRDLVVVAENKDSKKIDFLRIKGNKLYPVINFLLKYGFRTKSNLINMNVFFGLIIDIIFLIIGSSKLYYYFPIFTIMFVAIGYKKMKKAKKQNRLLKLLNFTKIKLFSKYFLKNIQ